MPEKGYVYILTNPSMPGVVKVGKTTRSVEQRANELYQTGVPEPFVIHYYVNSPNCGDLEIMVHSVMAGKRVSGGREFFRYTATDAYEILDNCLRNQVDIWLDEFMPDHVIVCHDEFVDIGAFRRSVYDAIAPSSICPPDFPSLLYELEGADLGPAIKRMEGVIAQRKLIYAARKSPLKIVGEA